jgi:small redox-active disulfide protein 2
MEDPSMTEDEVTRIRIGDSVVGIIGLKAVLEEMAGERGDQTDEEVCQDLLRRLGRKNYIPEKVKEEYGKAFLREFRKHIGEPVEEDSPLGLDIKVLGPGCVQCDRLEQELMQAMSETGITADVEHVRDIGEIGRYGVMGTPALLINGRVKAVGKVPTRRQLAAWLIEGGSGSQG